MNNIFPAQKFMSYDKKQNYVAVRILFIMGSHLLHLGCILCSLCFCVLMYYGTEGCDDDNDDDKNDDDDSDISLLV